MLLLKMRIKYLMLYIKEIGLVLKEINYHLKHSKKHMKPKKVKTPLSLFPAKSYLYKEPYGKVLIISPWNYPFLLALNPLVGLIAAGNTAVIKPSEYSVNTSLLIEKIIRSEERRVGNEYKTMKIQYQEI